MEGVTLTRKEQTRLQVLNSVLVDQVPVCQAAEVLGVEIVLKWHKTRAQHSL